MKRLFFVTVLALTVVAGAGATAHATEVGRGRNFGLGFQLGEPTAFIGKAFIGGDNAIDFGVGFQGWGYRGCYHRGPNDYCGDRYRDLSLHGDFLWQENLVHQQVNLDWHIGGGARVVFWRWDGGSDVGLFARVPIGLDLSFQRPSFLEVFFEIAPGLWLIPFADIDLDAALGVRLFF
jgi:opacity protein-like surface antigen